MPQLGSVRHIVPHHSPESIFAATLSRIQSSPVASSAPAAAPVNPGYIENDWLAEVIISATAMVIIIGMLAPPPNFSGAESAPQPASAYCL